MFVRGQISIRIGKQCITFDHQKISPFGVSGLPWPPLDPERHFGKSVFVDVIISQPTPLNFVVAAQIIREYLPGFSTMGLLFHFEDHQLQAFRQFTQEHGEPPIKYVRKFPRIPSIHLIQTYPLRVVANIEGQITPFEVENISPEGIGIFTDNQSAFILKPSQQIMLALDSPGNFAKTIHLSGTIRRILDDFDIATGTPTRHIGLQLANVPANELKNLMAMLKDILLQIKDKIKEEDDEDDR